MAPVAQLNEITETNSAGSTTLGLLPLLFATVLGQHSEVHLVALLGIQKKSAPKLPISGRSKFRSSPLRTARRQNNLRMESRKWRRRGKGHSTVEVRSSWRSR